MCENPSFRLHGTPDFLVKLTQSRVLWLQLERPFQMGEDVIQVVPFAHRKVHPEKGQHAGQVIMGLYMPIIGPDRAVKKPCRLLDIIFLVGPVTGRVQRLGSFGRARRTFLQITAAINGIQETFPFLRGQGNEGAKTEHKYQY